MAARTVSLARRLSSPSSLLGFSCLSAARRGGQGQRGWLRVASPRAGRPPGLAALGTGRSLCSSAAQTEAESTPDPLAHLRLNPWEYLDSEEYIERYGAAAVWKDYRRNHKGGIPPQKTRKTCVRAGKVCANPCPVCRDPKIILDFKNVRLLEQFICPHQGIVFDPSLTGLCQRQQKILLAAIRKAQDYGLLLMELPPPATDAAAAAPLPAELAGAHGSVAPTPPAPHLADGPWYPWYARAPPPPHQLRTLRRVYRGFLKKD